MKEIGPPGATCLKVIPSPPSLPCSLLPVYHEVKKLLCHTLPAAIMLCPSAWGRATSEVMRQNIFSSFKYVVTNIPGDSMEKKNPTSLSPLRHSITSYPLHYLSQYLALHRSLYVHVCACDGGIIHGYSVCGVL
jgi:hypothetical protein